MRRALLCLASVAAATTAAAAITAPALELLRVDATAAAPGALIRLIGSFPQADLVQQPLEIQVIVRETSDGARFARYELPVGGFEGVAAVLRDGLALEDVDALLAASQPSPAMRLIAFEPGRIELLLPASFPAGAAEAQLLLIYRGEPILSNPLPFTIPVLP